MTDVEKVAKQLLIYGLSIMGVYIFSRYLYLVMGQENPLIFVFVFFYFFGVVLILFNKNLQQLKIKTKGGRLMSYLIFISLYIWFSKYELMILYVGGVEFILFFSLGISFQKKRIGIFIRYFLILVGITSLVFFWQQKDYLVLLIQVIGLRSLSLTIGYFLGRSSN